MKFQNFKIIKLWNGSQSSGNIVVNNISDYDLIGIQIKCTAGSFSSTQWHYYQTFLNFEHRVIIINEQDIKYKLTTSGISITRQGGVTSYITNIFGIKF